MRQNLKRLYFVPVIFAAASIVCGSAATAKEPKIPAPIAQAVADQSRPAADRARDADRKPAQVLAFFGIKPGMTVLDLNSGSGYYSEILSRVVGKDGKVYAHNDDAFWSHVKDRANARYKDRLKNVTQIQVNIPDLKVKPDSVDVALLILAFHDFYALSKTRTKPVDVPAALAAIKAALKPGGVFGIIDHAAKPGSPPETGNTLHRIDPALLKSQVLAAGFVLDGKADFLHHPEDDHTKTPFAKGLRGKTDRFIYRFKKPQ